MYVCVCVWQVNGPPGANPKANPARGRTAAPPAGWVRLQEERRGRDVCVGGTLMSIAGNNRQVENQNLRYDFLHQVVNNQKKKDTQEVRPEAAALVFFL